MTCRRRKLKCDEQKPRCGQCCKANRECQLSSGIVFRHQQNASMNAESCNSDSHSSLSGFYAYKNTFNEDSVWLDIPRQSETPVLFVWRSPAKWTVVTFVNTTNPYTDPESSHPEYPGSEFSSQPPDIDQDWMKKSRYYCSSTTELQSQGLETLSAAALYNPTSHDINKTSNDFAAKDNQNPYLDPTSRQSNQAFSIPPSTSSLSNNNTNAIINSDPDSIIGPPIDPLLETPYMPMAAP